MEMMGCAVIWDKWRGHGHGHFTHSHHVLNRIPKKMLYATLWMPWLLTNPHGLFLFFLRRNLQCPKENEGVFDSSVFLHHLSEHLSLIIMRALHCGLCMHFNETRP